VDLRPVKDDFIGTIAVIKDFECAPGNFCLGGKNYRIKYVSKNSGDRNYSTVLRVEKDEIYGGEEVAYSSPGYIYGWSSYDWSEAGQHIFTFKIQKEGFPRFIWGRGMVETWIDTGKYLEVRHNF